MIRLDDMTFAVEDYYQEMIDSFEIDYVSSIFRKGFIVYPNGQRRNC